MALNIGGILLIGTGNQSSGEGALNLGVPNLIDITLIPTQPGQTGGTGTTWQHPGRHSGRHPR